MKGIAFILVFIIAMSPAAIKAFSQITKAEIIAGTMDLHEGGKVEIEATGKKNGVLFKFKCLWIGGIPVLIYSEPMGDSET